MTVCDLEEGTGAAIEGGEHTLVTRESRVLTKLRAGKVVSCFAVKLDAKATDIVGMAGFDCLWVDTEHTALDWKGLQAHIYAARNHDMDVMVRIPRGAYSDYIKPLELDAAGIMVPHVMGLEDARKVVQVTRFHPIGRRPLDGGNADGGHASMEYPDYIRQANKNRFVMIQIEDPEPLDELDEIAALEGIDMIFFGPGDFSHAIGAPGQWDHPKLLEVRRRIAEVCVAHGKYAGIPGNLDNAAELVEMGYRFISLGADIIGLRKYTQELAEGFAEKVGK